MNPIRRGDPLLIKGLDMKANEIIDNIKFLDKGENLEVKVHFKPTRNSNEYSGMLIVERVVTPDYISITQLFEPRINKRVK
jgi:uncharacterized protein YpiB (UPF0302 family)